MAQCRRCNGFIGNHKNLCGECEWAAGRPGRKKAAAKRRAFKLDYKALTDSGWPTLEPVPTDAA